MRRAAAFLFVVLAFPLVSPGQQPQSKQGTRPPAKVPPKWVPPAGPLGEARVRLLHGNYAEARAGFEPLLADDATRPAAAIGIGKAWCGEGEYDQALAVVDAALAKSPHSADLHAYRGDLLFDRGRWDEAGRAADTALKTDKDHFLARWVKARILRDSGNTALADTEIRWFVRTYTARSNADNDVVNPDELAIIGHAGAENARWHNISRQFSFILNEVYADAVKFDKDYWWAEYFAGMMLLEKYNRPDAVDAFDKALKINPKAVEPIVGKGLAAVQKFDLKEAEQFADEALKLNPKYPPALRLRAELHLAAGDPAPAEKLLLAAKAVNPRDAVTLGKLAGYYASQNKPDAVAAVVKEAEGYDAKPGQFYYEFAESLEERKHYDKAEEYYKKAADLRPMLIGPRNSLGLLFLRMGKEPEGKDVLEKAFKTDPFNVRVANMLKVLKHLEKYETRKTPHFEIRFDPALDKLLIEFVAEYLEETHAELKRQFRYEPPTTILFEVFNSHEMFSGRTIGLPDLHTIGASTGRIVAMASPAAKGLKRPFNWGRVVRHELTHVFNLSQTNFFCPHWFTEGLAVRNEHMSRPIEWTRLLLEAYRTNALFNLDTVMLGFVRPKAPDEWTLAYCQSHIYVEFLVKTYGEAAVAKLLDAYRTGVDTATALRLACGVEKPEFELKYKAHVAELLKPYLKADTVKVSDEKPMTLAELEAVQKKDPENVDLMARLADAYSRRDNNKEARKLVEAVLARQKGHPLATIVKAKLLDVSGDEDGAIDLLKAALAVNPDDPKLLFVYGRVCQKAKQFDKAIEAYEKGRTAAPLDAAWRENLAKIYTESMNVEKMLALQKEIVAEDPDAIEGRIRIAQAALAAKNFAEAEKYALDAVRIDVNNEEARKAYLESLAAQGKDAEVEKLKKRIGGE